MYNRENKYTIYIVTPEGEIIKVNLNWGKNIIKSLTRGGIAKLREYGWDIEKKRMINNKD